MIQAIPWHITEEGGRAQEASGKVLVLICYLRLENLPINWQCSLKAQWSLTLLWQNRIHSEEAAVTEPWHTQFIRRSPTGPWIHRIVASLTPASVTVMRTLSIQPGSCTSKTSAPLGVPVLQSNFTEWAGQVRMARVKTVKHSECCISEEMQRLVQHWGQKVYRGWSPLYTCSTTCFVPATFKWVMWM